MKHTQGPWTVWQYDHEVIKGPDDKAIAYIQTKYRDAETIEANAKLIAAAPELLEALEALFSAPTTDEFQAMENRNQGLFIKVQSALNKAKGVI